MKIRVTIFMLIIAQSLYAVEVGATRMGSYLHLLKGERVALIINHTSTVSHEQVHLLDTLLACGVDVRRVFAPEHGFRGTADAGESVESGRDVKTGVEIVSLYGATKRPTSKMLDDIDIVVFDIQDVGARFYTYISTMYYAMQACAQNDVDFMVLDRPNPCDYVAGGVLESGFESFVGALPLPILHGLTVGELAQMIVGQGWLEHDISLRVIPVQGWQHGQRYNLPIKPSPNLPNEQAVALYPSLCLFEATAMSIGRGTHTPFQVVGYPDKRYGTYTFAPESLVGWAKSPPQEGRVCYGVNLQSVDPPLGFTLRYFIEFMKLSQQGAEFIVSPKFFDKLAGGMRLRQWLIEGLTEEEIFQRWEQELEQYRAMRLKYLLYEDYAQFL